MGVLAVDRAPHTKRGPTRELAGYVWAVGGDRYVPHVGASLHAGIRPHPARPQHPDPADARELRGVALLLGDHDRAAELWRLRPDRYRSSSDDPVRKRHGGGYRGSGDHAPLLFICLVPGA